MRVLVVEASHEDRRAIVDALLPLEQIAVQGAVADVRSALRAIAQEAPDVVVTGTELADGSGIELIEAAQKIARPPRIVVVAPTATRAEWVRHLAAGADRFVERDEELDELRDVLGNLSRPATPAEDELRLIGRLAAGVTHDLNNYLGALSVTLAMIERQPDDPSLVGEAREAADRMARLTTAMLQYVRGEEPPLQPVDLCSVVRSTLRMLARTIRPEVIVRLDLSEKAKPVNGAAAELEQLVLNLVINALDAMPDGGELRIRVQPTATSAVFLEITNDGSAIGMPIDGAPPVHRSTKPGRRAGLGLGIVQRVVARHGGAVHIAPRTPGGTIATVFLPTA
jgi:signal transduction histidine kinase